MEIRGNRLLTPEKIKELSKCEDICDECSGCNFAKIIASEQDDKTIRLLAETPDSEMKLTEEEIAVKLSTLFPANKIRTEKEAADDLTMIVWVVAKVQLHKVQPVLAALRAEIKELEAKYKTLKSITDQNELAYEAAIKHSEEVIAQLQAEIERLKGELTDARNAIFKEGLRTAEAVKAERERIASVTKLHSGKDGITVIRTVYPETKWWLELIKGGE